MTGVSREGITKEAPEKSLVEPRPKSGGRNNTGRVTSRFIAGGHKQAYRIIDFKRDKFGIPAKVAAIITIRTVRRDSAAELRGWGETLHHRA